ncbi:hypothetical protein HAX54_008006, partial [Datura stramonium]|nr:hypothetical protein [Datura stramonium]
FKKKGGAGNLNDYKSGSAAYNVHIERSRDVSDQSYEQEGASNSGNNMVHIQPGACVFTQSQYDQIVKLLNQTQLNSGAGCSANIASNATT